MISEKRQMEGVAGWRGKFGYVCPGVLPGVQIRHFYEVVPEGVELFVVTLGITRLVDEQVEQALSKVDDAVQRLAEYGVDFVSLHGTPLVSIKGYGWDKELIRRVEDIAGCPATTSLTAAVDAFNALSVKKVVMASPMTDEMDRRTRKFLEDNGIRVINVKSLNLEKNSQIRELPENAAYNVAREAYLGAPEAEGIYIPCGAWVGPAVIEYLERDFGKPVITSPQATLWAGLKALKIRDHVKGYGQLFETLYSASV